MSRQNITITQAQVDQIKTRRAAGEFYADIAKDFPFSRETVRLICTGERLAGSSGNSTKARHNPSVVVDLIKAAKLMRLAKTQAIQAGYSQGEINSIVNEVNGVLTS